MLQSKCNKKTVQVLDKNSNRELVTLYMSEYGFCFLPGQVSSHKWISQMGSFTPHLPDGEGLSMCSWNSKHGSQILLWDCSSWRIIRLSITGGQRSHAFGSCLNVNYFNGRSGMGFSIFLLTDCCRVSFKPVETFCCLFSLSKSRKLYNIEILHKLFARLP